VLLLFGLREATWPRLSETRIRSRRHRATCHSITSRRPRDGTIRSPRLP
jgi:hypothetical protein